VVYAQTSLSKAVPPPLSASSATPNGGPTELSPALATLSAITSFEGLPVAAIGFRGFSPDGRGSEHLQTLIAQQVGQPLDKLKIRRSIQALYGTGYFSDVRVEAERTPQEEVRLVFVASENYFVGTVSVSGQAKRPTRSQLVNATKLQLGELFTREKLDRAIANIKSVMADNGYYKAEVQHSEEYNKDRQQVNVSFAVVPGAPARIGVINVQGNPGYSAGQIQDIAHMHPGDEVSAQRVTRALQNLRKKFQKQDRLEAQVTIINRSYRAQDNALDYTFNIDRGPLVSVKVEGAKFSNGVLKKYVPVYEEAAVDDDLLNEGRRKLRDYLQTQGYFDAEVSFEKVYDRSKNRLTVVYNVDRGTAHKLADIRIEGNKYFDDYTIRERMSVRPASGFLTHGLFSQTQLSRDVDSIQNLYKANGFLAANVKAETKYEGKSDDIQVTVRIDEGPQTRVHSVDIVGNKTFTKDQLDAMLTTIPGQPFSEFNLASDRDSVVNYYYNHGFPDIQFESTYQRLSENPNLVDVTFNIQEGDQVFVNRVLLSGLHYTRPYVVNREMRIHPGDPISQIGMLDSQRRLYDLGIFNEVDMAVQNPDGDAKYKDVLFDVREARRWTFNYGFGLELQTGSQPLNSDQISTAPAPGINVPPNTTPPSGSTVNTASPEGGTGISPRISFDLTRLNFRGRDHTLLFKSHLSSLSRRALVSYDAPSWFDRDKLRLTFTAFADNSRDVRTFSSSRIEGSVQAEQTVSKVTTLLYRFQYRRVSVDEKTLVISPELVPLLSKPVRVGMPSFSYIRDKRDDPIDTHKGNYTTFDTGVAAGVFGSATNFGRFMVQNSTYQTIKRKFVLARSTRIGVQEPFGTGDAAIVPLPERFFAGGSQLLRGFALNQAGPRDLYTGFPLGGNAVLVNQIELRMPPVRLPFFGDNMSFVLFHDAGNVFETGQDMVKSLFRWYQPRKEACSSESTRLLCDFNYMSHAVGLGARYKTPVGPVRIDASYNFNPPAFPFYVQCPSTVPTGDNPGPCASLPPSSLIFQSGTLRHFNFFFSIGQTF
jgi:outer membrane protein insertion porin family